MIYDLGQTYARSVNTGLRTVSAIKPDGPHQHRGAEEDAKRERHARSSAMRKTDKSMPKKARKSFMPVKMLGFSFATGLGVPEDPSPTVLVSSSSSRSFSSDVASVTVTGSLSRLDASAMGMGSFSSAGAARAGTVVD